MVNQVVEEFGRLDLLVSNAGILISGPLMSFRSKSGAVIEVNLVGFPW